MPELPDVTVYRECLEQHLLGRTMLSVALPSPFVLRTAVPPITDVFGRRLVAVRRIGKRVVLQMEGDLFLVLHLMIAGRLLWRPAAITAPSSSATSPPGKPGATGVKTLALKPKPVRNLMARFDFDTGSLSFTEAGTKRRASIHLVAGEGALTALDPGGVEPLEMDLTGFSAQLQRENHTLKRALTDPRLFSGIGNAYSDEILHRAKLSPIALTRKLAPEAIERLWRATREALQEWTERLREETRRTPFDFPETVTAFHPSMAVHGRFRLPCPVCGSPVQRIVYAENETNYCARCQTDGVVLKDRSLSRLLKASWPRSIDELG